MLHMLKQLIVLTFFNGKQQIFYFKLLNLWKFAQDITNILFLISLPMRRC